MKTKEKRKQEAWEEYWKKIALALKKYDKILREFEEIGILLGKSMRKS